MKIFVIGEFEAGSHRAHAINVVKTAGGFERLGHEVTVICKQAPAGEAPDVRRDPSTSIGALYGEPVLKWIVCPQPGPRGDAYGAWAAQQAAALGAEFVYARSFPGALACAAMGLPTVLETHAYIGDANPLLSASFAATRHARHPLRAIVTISPHLAEHYTSRSARSVHVVPDGVDLALFAPPEGFRRPARAGPPVALYAGHLYDYKGIPTILDAAALRPGISFELIGGLREDQDRVRERISSRGLANVFVRGAVDHALVPPHLWRADALLLPPSATEPSAQWTSPVKLGEYLASGRPIVASRIPGLETWVDEPAVRWFRPDDATDLAAAVDAAMGETAEQRAAREQSARELARQYSYPARASAILRAGLGSAVAAGAI